MQYREGATEKKTVQYKRYEFQTRYQDEAQLSYIYLNYENDPTDTSCKLGMH
jgi:hypothetical protein